ncbi:GSCOCG00004544001-RA-CDS [Cotesia congregata]|nr:GSCOCG00004544001-RA-CDS [Cotesia congregata]
MSCEKASRRLRYIIAKAKRFGLAEYELADLSGAKKITTSKSGPFNTWYLIALVIAIIICGTLVLALVCNPCSSRSQIHVH